MTPYENRGTQTWACPPTKPAREVSPFQHTTPTRHPKPQNRRTVQVQRPPRCFHATEASSALQIINANKAITGPTFKATWKKYEKTIVSIFTFEASRRRDEGLAEKLKLTRKGLRLRSVSVGGRGSVRLLVLFAF